MVGHDPPNCNFRGVHGCVTSITIHPPHLRIITFSVVSCVLMRDLSQPGNTLWEEPTSTLALVYATTSMSITILSTILIVGKLLFVRYQVRNIMGKMHREIYFSISAMLVESAFLYSAFALAFIVSYVENNTPVNQIFYQTIGQVTVCITISTKLPCVNYAPSSLLLRSSLSCASLKVERGQSTLPMM